MQEGFIFFFCDNGLMGNAAIFSGLYSSQIASADICLHSLLMVKEQAKASRDIKNNLKNLV